MNESALADRISAAISSPESPSAPATPSPAPSSTPAASPAPVPSVSAPTPTTVPSTTAPTSGPDTSLTFDDAPDLNFDDDGNLADTDPSKTLPTAAQPAQAAASPTPDPAATIPPTVTPTTPTQDEVANLARVLSEGGLPKEVETAFLKTNRGKSMLALFKAERVLRDLPQTDPVTGENTGGIGFMPTPDQIKEYHRAHSDIQAMENEFHMNPSSFLNNWFAPDSQGQFREGTEQVLSQIPAVIDQIYARSEQTGDQALKQRAIGMYASVFNPMARSYIDGLYQKALAIPETTDDQKQYKNGLLNAARQIEWDLFGKYKPDGELTPGPAPDPLAAREQAIAEREQRLLAWQQKGMTEHQKATEQQIFGTIDSNLTRDIEKALATVKDALPPRAYRAAVSDFKREVQEAARRDQAGFRAFNFSLSRARSSRGADALQAPVAEYQRISRSVIQARYRNVLSELVNGAVRQNLAQHQAAENGSAQRGPAVNGGQVPPQSVVPGQNGRPQRLNGEDRADYMARVLSERLSTSR